MPLARIERSGSRRLDGRRRSARRSRYGRQRIAREVDGLLGGADELDVDRVQALLGREVDLLGGDFAGASQHDNEEEDRRSSPGPPRPKPGPPKRCPTP